MKKYNHSEHISRELEKFKSYLTKKKLAENTVRQNRNYTGLFLEWAEKENIKVKEANYTDVLNFIDHCRKRKIKTRMVNRILLAIRYYYQYLRTDKNPAAGINLKGTTRTVPHDLLSKEELEELYEKYTVVDERSQRNKVILGLFIHQAITTDELKKLEPNHIKTREGKIYVPGSPRSNSRILKLEAEQILELHDYLKTIRPKILNELKAERPGRKPDHVKETKDLHQLFISMNGSENIKNSLVFLVSALRKLNPKVKSAKQIRYSVITEWLKEKDIRTVQYMAGHRYVSSTERYRNYNLQDLEEALEQHHPMK
ncbi:MAG: site-specific integrase [Bacteroidetes bacterium]|nr:site-specific integrase [Bacteroidota bacterium]